MKSKFKITYIPNNKRLDSAITTAIDETLDLYDDNTPTDIVVYNNIQTMDIKMAELNIIENFLRSKTEYVAKDKLYYKIQTAVKMKKGIIVLNGYDITLEDFRNEIYPTIKDKGIVLAINNIVDDEELKRSSTNEYVLEDDIDDEEWATIDKEIEEQYEEDVKKGASKNDMDMFTELMCKILDIDFDKDDNKVTYAGKIDMKDLPKLFSEEDKEKTNTEKKEEPNKENVKISETITYTNNNGCLAIDLLDNGDLELGNDSGEYMVINKSCIPFLLNYLYTLDTTK